MRSVVYQYEHVEHLHFNQHHYYSFNLNIIIWDSHKHNHNKCMEQTHTPVGIQPEPQLMPHWDYVVGEHNAHRCAPKRIERGVLYVACAHPVMIRELTFCKKMILKRLLSVVPVLKDIKFIAG